MANSEELLAILRLDLADYLKSLGQAETKADGFLNGFKGKAALLAGDVIGTTARALVEGVGTVVSFSAEASGAVGKLEAQLGLTRDEAEKLGDVGIEVFKNNFGGSASEAIALVGEVERRLQSLGDVSEDEVQKITEGAFALQDAFGTDTSATIDATKTLMDEFGFTGGEALDFITKAAQKGLPDDYLETITEYSNQFEDMGFTGAEMFSIIESGAAQGVLGTDKVADAFKEANLRLGTLDEGAVAAFEAMGLPIQRLEDGSVDVASSLKDVLPALGNIEDSVLRNSLGAAIFGTQWEDATGDIITGVDTTLTSMDDMAGATESLSAQYNTFGDLGEAAQRKILVALAPLGDKLLELANKVAPVAFAALDWIGEELPKWVDTALGWFDTFSGDLGSFGGKFSGTFDTVKKITEDTGKIIEVVWSAISGFFDENGSTIIEILTTTFDTVFTVVDAALTIIARVIDTVLAIIEGDWDRVWDNILEITSTIINTVATIIGNALDNIENAFSLLSNAIQSIWTSVMEWLQEKVGITVGFFDIDLFSAGAAIISSLWNGLRSKIDEMLGWLREQAQKISDLMPGSEPKDPTSPLRGLSNRGEAIMQNIQDGINRFGPLRLDLQSVVNQIGSGVGGVRADFQAGAASVINQISMDLRGSDGNEDRIRSVVNDAFREVVRDSRTLRLTG